jgi:hypothetical protein
MAQAANLLAASDFLERPWMTPPSNLILRIIVEGDPKLVRTLDTHYVNGATDDGASRPE